MSNIYNVREFGAVADGKTLDTNAIQAAIDTCSKAGGGTVVCDAGHYYSGSIELKSNVELHLATGCKIIGSTDISDYQDLVADGFKHENSPEGTATFLVGARHAENIAITGNGEMNASGPSFYDQNDVKPNGKFATKPKYRPRLLMFFQCRNIRIYDASFVDSPCWTFWLMKCEQITISRIRITGDQRMLNNDGIDIDGCKDVCISDCLIKTDDDCLVLRAIQSVYEEPPVCENITISNCNLESTCQCIRVSCPSDHIIRNAVFSNLTLNSSNFGISVEFPNRYVRATSPATADVHDVSFNNLVINSKNAPLRIQAEEGVKLQRVSGFTFSNIRATSKAPMIIKGNEHTKIEDISFNNMTITTTGDQAFICTNCSGIQFNNVAVENISC